MGGVSKAMGVFPGVAAGSILPVFQIVMSIAAYAPHMIAVLIVVCCAVRPSLRKYVILFPILVFLSLIPVVMFESHQFAAEEGYDMSLPTVREALETYIQTGEGDMNEIIEGGK